MVRAISICSWMRCGAESTTLKIGKEKFVWAIDKIIQDWSIFRNAANISKLNEKLINLPFLYTWLAKVGDFTNEVRHKARLYEKLQQARIHLRNAQHECQLYNKQTEDQHVPSKGVKTLSSNEVGSAEQL